MRRNRTEPTRARWVLAPVLCLTLVAAACDGAEEDVGAADEPAGAAPSDEDVESFYEGETLTIVVPAAPGGGADAIAQSMLPYLRETIPGQPNVVIQHDDVAGGIDAANRYFAQEPDGYTAFFSALTTTIPWLVDEPEVAYDSAALDLAIGVTATGVAIIDPEETGVESLDDLVDYDGPDLVKGGVSPISTDLMGVMALEVLGLREQIQEIWGYGGTGDHILAFEQGETNVDVTTEGVWSNNRHLEEEGRAFLITSYGLLQEDGTFERNRLTPDTPTVDEAHEIMYGEAPSGEMWEAFKQVMAVFHAGVSIGMHPDAPPEAVAAMRAGVEEMIEETDFLEQFAEFNPAEVMYGEEQLDAQKEQIDLDPEFQAWLREWLEAEYPDVVG